MPGEEHQVCLTDETFLPSFPPCHPAFASPLFLIPFYTLSVSVTLIFFCTSPSLTLFSKPFCSRLAMHLSPFFSFAVHWLDPFPSPPLPIPPHITILGSPMQVSTPRPALVLPLPRRLCTQVKIIPPSPPSLTSLTSLRVPSPTALCNTISIPALCPSHYPTGGKKGDLVWLGFTKKYSEMDQV